MKRNYYRMENVCFSGSSSYSFREKEKTFFVGEEIIILVGGIIVKVLFGGLAVVCQPLARITIHDHDPLNISGIYR